MAATPISVFCAGCCTGCECCDANEANAAKWTVSADMTGLINGTCSRCAGVNQGWRRSLWKTLCKDAFGCSWTSLFEQNSSTLSCTGNANQGARFTILCSDFNLLTCTLQFLYHTNGALPPGSMTVGATYQRVISGYPLACDGALLVLDKVSDDGHCSSWPSTLFLIGSSTSC